jgi:hypothetical protein
MHTYQPWFARSSILTHTLFLFFVFTYRHVRVQDGLEKIFPYHTVSCWS